MVNYKPKQKYHYQAIIKQETELVAKLQLRIYETIKNRSKGLKSRKNACKEFHAHVSKIDPILSGAYKRRNVKKSPLSLKKINRLRQVLKDAVENRSTREFKKYCSLAINIANPELVAYLISVSKQGTGAEKSRAKLMLKYVCT